MIRGLFALGLWEWENVLDCKGREHVAEKTAHLMTWKHKRGRGRDRSLISF
jgi:hypothetical protein